MRAVLQSCVALLAMAAAALGQDKMPWQPNLETAQRVAAETNRLVLIHFWAPWCRPCVRLEREVFSKSETVKGLENNFVMVKLNADEAPGTTRLYGVSSLPTDVITTPAGRMVSQIQSPPSVAQYVAQMNQAAEGHRSLARKPERPNAQQVAPRAGPSAPPPPQQNGASYAPQHAPGATPPAAPPQGYQQQALSQNAPTANDGYAEYFPQQQSQALRPDAQYNQVMPAQAYGAVPPTAPAGTSPQMVDPYASPATSQPPAVDPYAAPATPQGRSGEAFAAPTTARPPAVNPYAGSPAAGQPPAVAPYSAAPPTQPTMAPPPAATISQVPYNSHPPAGPPANRAADQPQLPPGCPSLGMDGNCPVTLVERKRWVVGHPAYGVVHRGRTYLFLGPQEKKKFLADPDHYSPVLSGIDPVLALDNQLSVPGRREYGVFGADGHVYLFADENSRARFEANEQAYAARALQATGTQYQARRPGQ